MAELPKHVSEMMLFSLSTGLREANVVGLQWKQIAMQHHCRRDSFGPSQYAEKAIAVPLNSDVLAVLRRHFGDHATHVFTYKRRPVTRANNHAWRKALKRAHIENFRWHDLRHTWASWHIRNGTTTARTSKFRWLGI